MLCKDQFMAAYKAINAIESLIDKADDLYREIPQEIQEAIRDYHSETGNLAYCIRWGMNAAAEIRGDWHNVVSGLAVEAIPLGQRIRQERKAKGMTQTELAEKIGISYTNISQLEREERNPTVKTVEKIADALGCPVAEFFRKGDGKNGSN